MGLKSGYFILIQLISAIAEVFNQFPVLNVCHDVSSAKQIINWALFTLPYTTCENLNPITEIIFDKISI